MRTPVISPYDPYLRQRVAVLDSEMAYVDVGQGDPIIFLHGNPTSSYLWRNIISHLKAYGRCLAPDLIGMGESGKNPAGTYRFVDHYRYLTAWLETVGATENAVFVIHDWGSALGFHWAYEQRDTNAVQGLAYMEAIVRPMTWEEWPEASRRIFQGFRSPKGEDLILKRNMFVERILPASVLRVLDEIEMETYRAPYLEAGESRRPLLTWPQEIPVEGSPADVHAIVEQYGQWLAISDIPKLFVNAQPGTILVGSQREFCRSWPNQDEVTVPGLHFVQEDSPHAIREAVAAFVQKIRD